MNKAFPLSEKTRCGSLRFYGCEAAELFTKEVGESLAGVLRKSITYDGGSGVRGFISASVDGRVCSDSMWSRDVGVFLRELANYGYLEHACLILDANFSLVGKNSEGYFAFPTLFYRGQKLSGSEVDGTGAMVIGMTEMWKRLPESNETRKRIYDFLTRPDSPLFYFEKKLKTSPLIPGTGEFGAGCDVNTSSEVYNVVQNNLARLALLSGAKMAAEAGDFSLSARFTGVADMLEENILKYFVDDDGTWMWCIVSDTMKQKPEIQFARTNVGFGGINGVGAMCSDVLGFEALTNGWRGSEVCRRTFFKLHENPVRKPTFDKYGMWVQFEVDHEGLLTSPSYGQGYAIQSMFLMNEMDLAEKAIAYLADATYRKPPFYKLDRESDYYFYERYYSPEAYGVTEIEQGCGALNLVNVGEPMKVARLCAGIDNSDRRTLKLIPRLPRSWSGFDALDWLVVTEKGLVRADISCKRTRETLSFSVKVKDGGTISRLELVAWDDKGVRRSRVFENVTEIESETV